MKSKTEMIYELQAQMETLIEDNLKLVKQMGELVKQQATMEKRLDALEGINVIQETSEQFQERMKALRKAS